jgi:hypothetical protein
VTEYEDGLREEGPAPERHPRWHLWFGSGIRRPRCEVCGTRLLVFRWTDGVLDVLLCWRHRRVVPEGPVKPGGGSE